MIVYLIFERPTREENQIIICGPHDELKAVCSSMRIAGQTLATMSFNKKCFRIEKHECADVERGKSIFVLLKHPEPNAPMMHETQVDQLRNTQFSAEEQRSKCDMAYSLQSVECTLK